MKTVTTPSGLFARLGILSVFALFAGQALALGTDAGTSVQNTATVGYSVAGTAQTPVDSNTASFVVDRRVDLTVTQVGAGLTQVTPGVDDYFVEFLVTNLSNGTLDINLDFAQLASADGDVKGAGTTDSDVDMNNVEIAVSAASDGVGTPGAGPDPVIGGAANIDDLAEDDSIRVRIFADAPLTLTNGQIANVLLEATAADPTTSANLVQSGAWDPDNIDNVFADGAGFSDAANDGIVTNADGFEAVTAALSVTKAQAVQSDPLGSGLAIPGAVVRYTITIENTGAVAANALVLTDDIDTDVTFGPNAVVSFNGGADTCVADDAADTDGDGCAWDGTTLTIDEIGGVAIDVAAGSTITVEFDVTIPTT